MGATGLVGLAVLLLALAFAEGSELPSFVRFFLRNDPKEGIRLVVQLGGSRGLDQKNTGCKQWGGN